MVDNVQMNCPGIAGGCLDQIVVVIDRSCRVFETVIPW
jgi:hypothetical protein